MKRTALLLVAFLATAPVTEAVAQATDGGPLPPVASSQEFPARGGPSTVGRLVSGIGGAALGAGLGFFASQLMRGDWQDTGTGQAVNRSLWALVGGSVGLTVGLRFPLFGGSRVLGNGLLPRGRQHLGLGDLQGRGFDNAYDAVALLRPEWLLIRGNRSLAASTDPVVVDGLGTEMTVDGSSLLISEVGTIQVYIDGVRTGGLLTLKTVNTLLVRDLYLLSAGEATTRWGGHLPHGAILVITM